MHLPEWLDSVTDTPAGLPGALRQPVFEQQGLVGEDLGGGPVGHDHPVIEDDGEAHEANRVQGLGEGARHVRLAPAPRPRSVPPYG